ncbi:MAG: VanR-ABDEGLN family response regulator transcription factor [Bacilli bacterium]|nr:VanR-ABDEGLN family response regulator transcription factor [Bacilli bacterium]
MNVLVVDDEQEIADLIEIYLKNEGYSVFKSYDSVSILSLLDNVSIDLAILDVMMPGLDGFSLCQKIREKYNFPIIFVTAKVEDLDKINGLLIGADDYITKPFLPLELIARVKAQLRRYKKYNDFVQEDVIDFRGIVLNKSTHEFYFNEKLIALTPIEFSILWCLCESRGIVVKTEDLFKKVWNEAYYENDNNTIMVHIRQLRQKMGDIKRNPKYIKTIWGVGYKIEK